MIVVTDPAHLPPDPRPVFLAIGVFDGVHRGHQRLLAELVGQAREAGSRPLTMTFDPHPQAVLADGASPPLLTTLAERSRLIAAFGVEALLVLPFNAQLARVPADTFLREWLCPQLHPARIFVGYNFAFGHRGQGNPDLLAALGGPLGYQAQVIPPVRVDGQVVSSTLIRQLLQAGRVEEAARAMGRPHSLVGTVVPGAGRGRTLGVPTANLAVPSGLCRPAPGVYAVRAELPAVPPAGAAQGAVAVFDGVANIGWRPTFGGAPGAPDQVVLEIHLFDFAGDLYGQGMRVSFIRRLREERAFPSVEALRNQVAADLAVARTALATPAAGASRYGG